MNFLYPQLLYGLAALSIPIIIHLFSFRRTKKVFFSSNRFLQNIQAANRSRVKLKHWLVLASRLLFVFFLVLAFAQPFLPSEGEKPGDLVKIYVDNSYSMSNEVANDITAFDQALTYTQVLLEQYPKHTHYQLLTNEFTASSEKVLRYDALLDALTEIKLSPVSRTLEEVVSRMAMSNKGDKEALIDNYIISDFQKSTASTDEIIKTDSAEQYNLIPIDFLHTGNLLVDSVFLANPFLLEDNTNVLKVKIANRGEEAKEDIILRLFVNEIQVATAGVNVNAQSSAVVNFDINFKLEKHNRCRISFEDFPVTFDNNFFFALNTAQKIDILEISGDGASEVLSKVYANQELFAYKKVNINNFDYSYIQEADLVFLNEVKAYNSAIVPYLQQYVEGGGTVAIVFGAEPDPEALSFLSLPEHLQRANTAVIAFNTVDQPDLSNPFFANIFEGTDEKMEMPQAFNTVNWRSAGMDLLKYKNGMPYVSRSVKENVFYIGGPFKDEFTNFHKQAIFVPIMYRLAALSQSISDKLYHYINDPQFSTKKEEVSMQDVLKLKSDEEEIIPALMIAGNRAIMEVPKHTLNPGFYTLTKGDSVVQTLAFNYNKAESYLEQLSRKELSDIFGGEAKVYEEGNVDTFKAEIKELHEGKALWKNCLALALLFLLVEIMLIRFLK